MASVHSLITFAFLDLRCMCIYGAYTVLPKQKRQKLDARAKKCIFVGYDDYQKGFRVMDEFNRISVARDVKFLTEEASTVTFIDEVDDVSGDNDTTNQVADHQEVQQQQKPAPI